MCQFNLVFVKNNKNKKILKEKDYHHFCNNINNFSTYVKWCCNCNSFVGSMCEYSGNSYREMIESSNKSELENLNKIKILLNNPDYSQLKENYIKTRDSFSNDLEKLLETLSNYEMEQINLLEKKYKGKELQKHMELLYQDLETRISKIENSSEYKAAQAKLNEFIEKNKLMDESTLYYLTKEDEESEYFSAEEFFSQDEEIEDPDAFSEYINISEEESLVIDNVIKRLENKYETDFKTFLKYKQLFEQLLENEEYILFSCIWDKPEKMLIEKEVSIKDIKIEDLASLKFNKMIKIHR